MVEFAQGVQSFLLALDFSRTGILRLCQYGTDYPGRRVWRGSGRTIERTALMGLRRKKNELKKGRITAIIVATA